MTKAICELCGEPMTEGEDVFKFHGYSGPCPKPPLPQPTTLEKLLRMTVPVGPGCVAPEGSPMSPDFRLAVQNCDGVTFDCANGFVSRVVSAVAQNNIPDAYRVTDILNKDAEKPKE